MDLRKNYLRDVPLEHCIKRGTAVVLEESDTGLFLWDNLGWVYMLVNDNYDEAVSWLKKHEEREYDLMTIYRDDLARFINERYGLNIGMECYQGAWLHDKAPAMKGLLDIKHADMNDLSFILENYAHGHEEWMREVIKEKLLYIACDESGNRVGFGGQHLEGSIGMIQILPEFRNKGYAAEMESFMIDKIMKEGFTPYGQVFSDNEASMALQRKMGFEFWEGTLCWMYKHEDESDYS